MAKGYIKSKVGADLGFRTPDFVKQSLPLRGKQANVQKLSKFGGKKPILNVKYGPSSVRTQHKGGK